MVEPVLNGRSAAVVHGSVEQDQEVPVGIRVRITSGTRPVEDNARRGFEIMERLTDTLQETAVTIGHGALLHTCASGSLMHSILCWVQKYTMVGQKPPVRLAVVLLDRSDDNMALLTQLREDIFRVVTIFQAISRVKTVERHLKRGFTMDRTVLQSQHYSVL
jgi:hypothetical protein